MPASHDFTPIEIRYLMLIMRRQHFSLAQTAEERGEAADITKEIRQLEHEAALRGDPMATRLYLLFSAAAK